MNPAGLVEVRFDPADGGAYTKEEFVGLYGGTNQWDAAAATAFMGQSTTVLLAQQQAQQQGGDSPMLLGSDGADASGIGESLGEMVGIPEAVSAEVTMQFNQAAEAAKNKGKGKARAKSKPKPAKRRKPARDDGLIESDEEDEEFADGPSSTTR